MNKLLEKQKQELIHDYLSGEKVSDLVIKYGFKKGNHHSILRVLKKYNIPIRQDQKTIACKYTIDETFFENINTKEKAYFLGLLYADGYLSIQKNEIKISLMEDDKSILDRFNTALKTNKPLRYIKNNSSYNRKPQYSLCIERKKLSEDLINLNFPSGQEKTDNLDLPIYQIPKNLQNHFLRGFFDGDGCITSSKSKNYISPVITFSSTLKSVETLRFFIYETLNTNKNLKFQKRYKNKNTNNGYSLSYGGKKIVKKLYDYMYDDCDDLYIKRKKEKFNKFYSLVE